MNNFNKLIIILCVIACITAAIGIIYKTNNNSGSKKPASGIFVKGFDKYEW